MDNSKYYIPSCLDEPIKFFGMNVTEIIALFLCLVFGIITKNLLLFCGIGFLLFIVMRYFKNDESSISFQTYIYWYLPSFIGGSQDLPQSLVKKFLG